MKNIKFLILFITAGLFLLNSCEEGKDVMPENIRATSPVMIMDVANSSPFINVAAVNDYTLTFDVDVLFDDAPFVTIDIMVAVSGDYSKHYLLQTITTVPSTVTVTGPQFIAAIDELASTADVAEGDVFQVFCNVTMADGTYLPGLLWNGMATLAADNKNLAAILKGATGTIRIGVPCGLDPALTIGSYHSVSLDWGAEGDVMVTADAIDPFKVYVHGLETMEGLVENATGCPMVISSVDYSLTILPVPFVANAWGYSNMYYQGTGTYDTCTGKYTFAAEIRVDQGGFGTFNFVMTRN